MRHDLRLTGWTVLLAGPLYLLTTWAIASRPWPMGVRLIAILAVTIWVVATATRLRGAVLDPMRTAAALLQGLREGNYSARARGDSAGSGVGHLLAELNALADVMQHRRLTEVEASALLATVMAELESAVLAFDGRDVLVLANPAAGRLFGRPVPELLGKDATTLGCRRLLEPQASRLVSLDFPNASGRWEVRQSTFRQDGLPHQLVVLTDVSRTLHEEEREAWRRLIRVLSHELNNSLTPITSIANSLAQFVDRGPLDEALGRDLRNGLGVIEQRANGLNRFLRHYATLATLPPPQVQDVDLRPLVARVIALSDWPAISASGPDCRLKADPDQVEQLLINLVRNAVDAVRETKGRVVVSWSLDGASRVAVRVTDDGPGIASGADVFVPFFTTKPGGTGIGLALCRQIADAHGGTITLRNRLDGPGAEAVVHLPRA